MAAQSLGQPRADGVNPVGHEPKHIWFAVDILWGNQTEVFS